MIVLDTNVVSEAMKPEPHLAVRAWLNDQAAETLYLSGVTLAELLFGIAALPAGKRKALLGQALDGLMGLGSAVALRHRCRPPLCRAGRDGENRRARIPDSRQLHRRDCRLAGFHGGIPQHGPL